MQFINLIEGFLYRSRPARLIGATLAIAFVKTGIWYMPNIGHSRIVSFNPFQNPFPDPNVQYMFWNWLGPFLAWRFRIHNETSFLYFHLLFSIIFTGCLLRLVWSQLEDQEARASLVIFLSIPVSTTAYYWIGMDSITLALMALILVARARLWLALPLAILLGMQHFEQAFMAFGALVFGAMVAAVLKTKSSYPLRWAATSLAGVLLGKIVLLLIFHHYGIQVNSGRIYWLQQAYGLYLNFFYYHFAYAVWGVCGVGWVVIAKYVEQGKIAAPFTIALLGLMVLLPLVDDETRVLSIVTFPLMATCLLLNRSFLQSLSRRYVSAIFGLWLIVPYPWVWHGIPQNSIFPYDVAYVFHRLFGWFNVPTNQPLWPF